MVNFENANLLIKESRRYNTFGAANIYGTELQRRVQEKFLSGNEEYNAEELSILKPVIAQYLIQNESRQLSVYAGFSDSDLSEHARIKKRTLHSLELARLHASCGSFNCEVGNLIVYLAIKNNLTSPVELVNFSGVRDDTQDTLHTFITLGCTDKDANQSLAPALFHQRASSVLEEVSEEELIVFGDYVICDAHHCEAYPITRALSKQDERLARYDIIDHQELPRARRFLYIENPSALLLDPTIQKACGIIEIAKNEGNIKTEVIRRYRECLTNPFKSPTVTLFSESNIDVAVRRAAAYGKVDYLDAIIKEFMPDVDKQDINPVRQRTALHWAIIGNHTECAKKLLEAGADTNIADANGQTPLQLMQESENDGIKNLSAYNDKQEGEAITLSGY